jgi:hypothetical protein
MKKMNGLVLGMAAAVAAAGTALGSGAGDWERAMAARRPGMPSENTRAAWRATRGMQERTANAVRAGCAAVANGALAASGASLPAGAEWETAYSSMDERVEVAAFTDEAGRANRVAVYEQIGNQVPYYWSVEDGDADAVAATAGEVWEVDGVLNRADVEMAELGEEIVPPYERFRFRFLDDAPGQDWIRPCRYLFEDADGNGTTVLWKKMPPKMVNRATGGKIRWKGETETELASEEASEAALNGATAGVRKWQASLRREPNAAAEEQNHSGGKTHFVLFSGGGDTKQNGIRFWCDAAMLYSTLRLGYGVPKERIHAFVSDGLSNRADANLGGRLVNVYVDSPKDLDGDGTRDVEGPATREELQGCLASLARTLGPDDRLWVFVTSHGGPIGEAAANNRDAQAWGWAENGRERFTDAEFAEWLAPVRCPVAVALEPCFSGGFADDLKRQADRVVATAASHHEASFGSVGQGTWADGILLLGKMGTAGKTGVANCWAQEFVTALRGVRPANLEGTAYPWQDGKERVDSDRNGDGRVSFAEAAAWAAAQDTMACRRETHSWEGWSPCLKVCGASQDNDVEHPQYAESRKGLGEEMFIGSAPRNAGAEEEANGGPAPASLPEGDAVRKPSEPTPHLLPIPKAAFKNNGN